MTVTTALNPTASNNATNEAGPIQSSSADGLASREAFLQMLVAQIQNQDPLNPTDSVEFLSQLAQFSELEQMLGMRQDLASLRALAEAAAATPSDSASTDKTPSGL